MDVLLLYKLVVPVFIPPESRLAWSRVNRTQALIGIQHFQNASTPGKGTRSTQLLVCGLRNPGFDQFLDKCTGLAERATLIIVSDHGFRSVQHKLRPNVLLREKGIVRGEQGKPISDAWVMSAGGLAMVYVSDPARKATMLPDPRAIFTGVEGIDQVYGVEDFPKLGLPMPAMSDQAPDLVLAAKPGYGFANESEGAYVTPSAEGGTHGYLNTDPKMQAIFVAWGAGVPKGVRLDSISNLDVAPTIAALLGLEMRHVQGHIIRPIVLH